MEGKIGNTLESAITEWTNSLRCHGWFNRLWREDKGHIQWVVNFSIPMPFLEDSCYHLSSEWRGISCTETGATKIAQPDSHHLTDIVCGRSIYLKDEFLHLSLFLSFCCFDFRISTVQWESLLCLARSTRRNREKLMLTSSYIGTLEQHKLRLQRQLNESRDGKLSW